MVELEPQPRDPLIGSSIDGRYSIHELLGRGGMGVVYAGVHDHLQRPVAIKVLNAAWASDPVAVERFLREARTASSLSHGNIVDVTDLGRLPDGRPYLVMPKVDGTDLASLYAQAGPQPPKRVAELLGGVASALDLIHAKGLVHRDIKPENLMYVVREDGSETVMLLDFGIAALVMSNQPRLTRQGAIFGTPEYLPPEVCDGRLPDRRGDVYALATVAFELITGKLPFNADNPFQILPQKLARDAPTLARASGVQFPAELETVIARGLAREPEDRYGTASELIGALRTATASVPVSWRPGVMRVSRPDGLASEPATTLERMDTTDVPSSARQPADSGSLPAGSHTLEEAIVPSSVPEQLGEHVASEQPAAAVPSPTAELVAAGIPSSKLPRRLGYGVAGALLLASALAWAMHRSAPEPVVVPAAPAAPAPVVTVPEAPAPSPEPVPATEPAPPAAAPVARPASKPVPKPAPKPARPSVRAESPRPAHAPAPVKASARPPAAEPRPVVKPSPEAPRPAPAPPAAPARDLALAAQLTREGTSDLLAGRLAHASTLLRKATQADPGYAAAWRSLGLVLERQHQAKQAVAAYRQSLRLEPQGLQADKVRERIADLQK